MSPPIEGTPDHYLTADAVRRIASDIAEAGGVEVFFIGRPGRDGLVHEIESHAFGSDRAVPVLLNLVKPGEVIVHNHPSGQLAPSDADLSISANLGNLGVGSYIVNNDCTRLRVVVRPHDVREKELLDGAEVERLLKPGSPLAAEMEEFEDRPQQTAMARAVADAFNADGIAMIEAGTGTGKSLAYLIPSVLFALANKQRVVVSTHTITLQEQILTKDLPVVERALGREFRAVLVKGRSNYVCKRKAAFAREELAGGQLQMIADGQTAELREVLEWAEASPNGDRAELSVPPAPEVWERVVSESDNCLRLRCPHYEECFFYNSRRRAARADVLVVNHSLLLSDLAVRRETNNWSGSAVLPPFQHAIVDEAHHLEESATNHLASQISLIGIRRLFNRLMRADRGERKGVVPRLHDAVEAAWRNGKLPSGEAARNALLLDVLSSVDTVRQSVELLLEDAAWAFIQIARLEHPSRQREQRVRVIDAHRRDEGWESDFAPVMRRVAEELAVFLDANRRVVAILGEIEPGETPELANVSLEWQALLERLEGQRRLALSFLRDGPEVCRWLEIGADRRGHLTVRLCQAPVSVAALLEESLHRRMRTEVLTSATLTVDSRFDFVADRIGLNPARFSGGRGGDASDRGTEQLAAEATDPPPPPVVAPSARSLQQVQLATPFDYERQVFFGVPQDIGDPRGPGFAGRLAELVFEAVAISEGRALVLFTSYGQLRQVHERTAPLVRKLGFECLAQGEETRDRLLRRFREDETSVLFATSSFWEGVDVRGRALELLVIARLPFSVPTDPVTEAQYEYLRLQGRDPFGSLVVPRAVIRFRQGFGRLIRSRSDRGAVLIADDRVVRMGYGQRFVRSLPGIQARTAPARELLEEMATFYRSLRTEA